MFVSVSSVTSVFGFFSDLKDSKTHRFTYDYQLGPQVELTLSSFWIRYSLLFISE